MFNNVAGEAGLRPASSLSSLSPTSHCANSRSDPSAYRKESSGAQRRDERKPWVSSHMSLHILAFPMGEYLDHEVSDDPLHVLRHSTAHLLAAAVTELYPDAKYAIGPAIENPPGFYYDFDFGRP